MFKGNFMKSFAKRFFADEGVYPPAGIPSAGYFILIFLTIFIIGTSLHFTLRWSYADIRMLLRVIIITLWILEIIKIAYRWHYGYKKNLNTWVPLYFCSITLFAGLLSSFAKGIARHIGDVFICTGGLVGGVCFLMYPSTSLPQFPACHFLSIHSFLYHGCMTFLGILLNRSHMVNLTWHDMIYVFCYTVFFCLLALILNLKTGSDLMFLNQAFPGDLGRLTKKVFGKFYSLFMILVQSTAPFVSIMLIHLNTTLLG